MPVQLQGEAAGSSSSEHGSVSPDCDAKHDVFFQKKKSSGSENLLKPPNSNYLRRENDFTSLIDLIAINWNKIILILSVNITRLYNCFLQHFYNEEG